MKNILIVLFIFTSCKLSDLGKKNETESGNWSLQTWEAPLDKEARTNLKSICLGLKTKKSTIAAYAQGGIELHYKLSTSSCTGERGIHNNITGQIFAPEIGEEPKIEDVGIPEFDTRILTHTSPELKEFCEKAISGTEEINGNKLAGEYVVSIFPISSTVLTIEYVVPFRGNRTTIRRDDYTFSSTNRPETSYFELELRKRFLCANRNIAESLQTIL